MVPPLGWRCNLNPTAMRHSASLAKEQGYSLSHTEERIREIEQTVDSKENLCDGLIKENQQLVSELQRTKEQYTSEMDRLKREATHVVQRLLEDTQWYRENQEAAEARNTNIERVFREKASQLNIAERNTGRLRDQCESLKRYTVALREQYKFVEIENRGFRTGYQKLKGIISGFGSSVASGKFVSGERSDLSSLLMLLTEEARRMQVEVLSADEGLAKLKLVPPLSATGDSIEKTSSGTKTIMAPMSELVKLKHQKKALQAKYEKQVSDFETLNSYVDKLREEIAKRAARISQLNLQVQRQKSLETDARSLRLREMSFQEEVKRLKSEIKTLRQWKSNAVQATPGKGTESPVLQKETDKKKGEKVTDKKKGESFSEVKEHLPKENQLRTAGSITPAKVPKAVVKSKPLLPPLKKSLNTVSAGSSVVPQQSPRLFRSGSRLLTTTTPRVSTVIPADAAIKTEEESLENTVSNLLKSMFDKATSSAPQQSSNKQFPKLLSMPSTTSISPAPRRGSRQGVK